MIIRNVSSGQARQEYKKVYDIALGSTYGNGYFPEEHYPAENIFGCYVKDKLVSAMYIVDFNGIKIRNKLFKTGGVEGVLTLPGYRGNGYSKRLFTHVFKTMNERKQYLSVLFPISHQLYEKIGYGIGDEHVFYQFEIGNIKRKKYDDRTFRMVDGITDEIKMIYDEASKKYNYMAKREELQWKIKEDQSDFKFVCYDESENPVGYCFLKFLKGHYLFKEPSNTLHVPEAFWLDNDTKHAMIQDFLYSFGDQRKYGSIVLPMNENLIELLAEPIIQTRAIKPSSRIRIINVKEILSKLEHQAQDFRLVIKVNDSYCEWNNKTFTLKSDKGIISITEEDGSNSTVDLDIDIATLSQLFVGSRSIKELLEFKKITVRLGSLPLIDELFPKKVNYFRDFF
ncbi:MAG: GNAT family N-acetyltransferase [Candidatus Hodarchaeales archaeon]